MTYPQPKKGLRTPMMTRTVAAARREHAKKRNYGAASGGSTNMQGQNRVSHNKNRIHPREAFDKYSTLAKEALAQEDRVLAENYYQYADHYYRLLLEIHGRDQEIREEEIRAPSFVSERAPERAERSPERPMFPPRGARAPVAPVPHAAASSDPLPAPSGEASAPIPQNTAANVSCQPSSEVAQAAPRKVMPRRPRAAPKPAPKPAAEPA